MKLQFEADNAMITSDNVAKSIFLYSDISAQTKFMSIQNTKTPVT